MTKPPLKRHATSATRKGNGTGYGGPAKGSGADAPMQAPFEAGNQVADGTNQTSPIAAARRATRDSMMQVYERIAADENAPPVAQIMAADKWLDRKEGKAIARTVSLDPFADLTHDQLDALLAAAERADDLGVGGAAAFGEAAAPIGKPH